MNMYSYNRILLIAQFNTAFKVLNDNLRTTSDQALKTITSSTRSNYDKQNILPWQLQKQT